MIPDKPYATMGDSPKQDHLQPEVELLKHQHMVDENKRLREQIGPEMFMPIQLIGKGSFGEVYLVQMKSNSKLYAMKVLQKENIFDRHLV